MKQMLLVTTALLLAAVAATLLPGQALELQRGGGAWRLVTCHFTHWTYEQLAWDGLAFAALAIACMRRSRAAFLATLLTSLVVVPLAVLRFAPDVTAYRGLSGLASALLGFLLVPPREEGATSRSMAALRMAVATLFLGKLAYELVTAGTVFVRNLGSGVISVPIAHLAGMLVGVVVGCVWRQADRGRRRAAPAPLGGQTA